MAPWQVMFQVVPHRAMAGAPGALTRHVVQTADWWGIGVVPRDLLERLAAVATPAATAGAGVERWGSAEGNSVEVHRINGRVSRITACVDVRKLDAKFGAALLGFVRSAQSVLIRDDGWVAEPTVSAFSHALRGHPAWSFASEPAPLRIAREPDDDEDDE
jgi:hypothetical protein